MATMTYTRCPVCENKQNRPPCVCDRGEAPGYAATGLTLGQIDRMVERERALSGDPSLSLERRQVICGELKDRLGVSADRENLLFEFAEQTALLLACLRNYKRTRDHVDLAGALQLEPEVTGLLAKVRETLPRAM